MIRRGDICWTDLGESKGSRPAQYLSPRRRPVLVVQSDPYNASRLSTVLVATVTSNTALGAAPGNVFLPAGTSGLSRDSVVNVSALVTVNKDELDPSVGHLSETVMRDIERGLRSVLGL